MPKQSDRLAATLYSPPDTWMSKQRPLRKGVVPGSSRWIRAPSERKSSAQGSVRSGSGMKGDSVQRKFVAVVVRRTRGAGMGARLVASSQREEEPGQSRSEHQERDEDRAPAPGPAAPCARDRGHLCGLRRLRARALRLKR